MCVSRTVTTIAPMKKPPPDRPIRVEGTETHFVRLNSTQDGEQLGEFSDRLVAQPIPRKPALLIHGRPETTLTRFLNLETWTPLEAALLAAGVLPNEDYTSVPEQAMCLDHRHLPIGHQFLRDAKRILHEWNSQEVAPSKVRPSEFVAWCEAKQINTDWLRDVPTAPKRNQAEDLQREETFSMTRKALVDTHRAVWPTVEADLRDASKNGLAAAKAGARGWREDVALQWARAKGRLLPADSPADAVARAIHNTRDLPSRSHRVKG